MHALLSQSWPLNIASDDICTCMAKVHGVSHGMRML